MGRFSPRQLFRAHWKGLSDYRQPGATQPDRSSRVAIIATPVVVFVVLLWYDRTDAEPGMLETIALAALAMLAGGLLGAFTHLSGVRLRLAERESVWGEAERPQRDYVDETAAHLLVGSYLSVVAGVLMVISYMIAGGLAGRVIFAASYAVAAYVVVVFLLTIPRLYVAYASMMHVRDEISGLSR